MSGDWQKSRAGQSVDDETVAKYTAAKGFLVTEMLGALLMVYSFTHLYVFGLRTDTDPIRTTLVGVLLLILGGIIYWRSRSYYLSLDFPWQRKWEVVATVFAGSAAVFWFMFLVASILLEGGIAAFG